MSKNTVLFYHAPCPDGFGSAYAFWRKFGDKIDYTPLSHDSREKIDLDIYNNKKVFMADIALQREPLLRLKDVAKSLIVLDHHKTNMETLGDLDFCHFDMNHSGAVISWNYLFKKKAPKLLRLIEDRDLWRWSMPQSDDILLYVDSIGYDFDKWLKLEIELEDDKSFDTALGKGEAILKYRDRIVNDLIGNVHILNIKGYDVPSVNSPFFKSELISKLTEPHDVPFAAGYYFNGKQYIFSLRSTYDGVDVSKVAQMFPGGGGHRNASGFSVESLENLK